VGSWCRRWRGGGGGADEKRKEEGEIARVGRGPREWGTRKGGGGPKRKGSCWKEAKRVKGRQKRNECPARRIKCHTGARHQPESVDG